MSDQLIQIGNLTICADTHQMNIAGEAIHLRNKLFHLLMYLAAHKNKLVSRNDLIDNVWSGNYYIGEKGLTHAICILRNLLKKEPGCGVSIDTIPKSGYRLKVTANNKQENQTNRLNMSEIIMSVDTSKPSWWPTTLHF